MLGLSFDGPEKLTGGLGVLASGIPGAVQRGLRRAASGVHREAAKFLAGSRSDAPGSYPVPRRTGHLSRMLFSIGPGRSYANAFGFSVSTGPEEAIVGNSAEYAEAIHQGRPFLTDGFEAFDREVGIVKPIEDEIRKEIRRRVG